MRLIKTLTTYKSSKKWPEAERTGPCVFMGDGAIERCER
jgi:hypothetical protein